MRILQDYYLVGLSHLTEQAPSVLYTPTPQELMLAGMSKEQIALEEQKVIAELKRISSKYTNKKRQLKAGVEFLRSVGWEMYTQAGNIVVSRIKEDPNKEAHPSMGVRYYGKPIAIPQFISDTFYESKDAGFPMPLTYKPNEVLQVSETLKYACTDFVPEKVLLSDVYKPRFHNCDTVYFFWNARNESNYFTTIREGEKETYVFKIHCSEMICGTSVVDNNLVVEMNDQMVLIEPLPMSPENIKTVSGIYAQTATQGTVAQFGTIVYGEKAGTMVCFEDAVACPITILGKKYLALSNIFLLAYIIDGEPKPVNGYVLIRPDKQSERTSSGVYLPKKDRKPVDRAEVVEIGDEVKTVSIGDMVVFGRGLGLVMSKDRHIGMLIIKEIDLVAIV